MASLVKLPTELHQMIFAEVHSTQDLYNYIKASRTIYQNFAANPNRFISLALQNSIHIAARPWALALRLIPATEFRGPRHIIRDFLGDHFRNGRYTRVFPTDRASLAELALENQRLNRFIQHFVYTAFYGVPAWLAAAKAWQLKSEHNLKLIENKSDTDPGSLPYWATSNHERRSEYQSAELQAISSLSTLEIARLQRAFYAYEFYCRAVQSISMTMRESISFRRLQYDWILAHIPSFQIEEMSNVHQYYISMAGKLFDQVENDLVDEVLNLPYTELQPASRAHIRLDIALRQDLGSQTNFRELQSRLTEMERSFSHAQSNSRRNSDGTRFYCSKTSLLCDKPSRLVGFTDEYLPRGLSAYCDGAYDPAPHLREAISLSSMGAAYIEEVLCSPKSVRPDLLGRNLDIKCCFLGNALSYMQSDTSRSFEASEDVDRPIEDNLDFPSFGWYTCHYARVRSHVYDSLYDPYREAGHIFWDMQRMIKEPLRSRLIDINNNYRDFSKLADYWPRNRDRASSRLKNIWITPENMQSIIGKYGPV